MWNTLKKIFGLNKAADEKSDKSVADVEIGTDTRVAVSAEAAVSESAEAAISEPAEEPKPDEPTAEVDADDPLMAALAKRRKSREKSADDDDSDGLPEWAEREESDSSDGDQNDIAALVLKTFDYVNLPDPAEAVAKIEPVLSHPDLDREDGNTVRMFNNYLIRTLHAKLYEKGAAFADSIQDVAPLNPNIYHNAACLYCFTDQLEKAIEQIQLGRQHGGLELMALLKDDDELTPIMDDSRWHVAINPTIRCAESVLVNIPEQGIAHPAFSTLEYDQAISVIATFAENLEDADFGELETQLATINLDAWQMAVEAANNGYTLSVWGQGDIAALLKDIQQQIMLFRTDLISLVVYKRELDDGQPGSMIPLSENDRFMHAETQEEFWQASFSEGPYPHPEDNAGMFSVGQLENGQHATELRPDVLAIDGIRLSYGLTEVDQREGTERARELCSSLQVALARYFAGEVPSIWNMQGGENECLDCMEKEGRHGYSFAIKRDLFTTKVAGNYFRHREHELMYALRDVIQQHTLANVVHWDRGSVYIINLWEQ